MPASPFILALDPTVYVSAFYVWIALSFVWLCRNLLTVRKLRKREAELNSTSAGLGLDTAATASSPASVDVPKSEDHATRTRATAPAKPSASAPPARLAPSPEPTTPAVAASSPAEAKTLATDDDAAPSTPTSARAPDRPISPVTRPVPTPDGAVNVPSSVRPSHVRPSPHGSGSQASDDAALTQESVTAQPPTKPETSDTIASLLMGIRLPFDLLPTVPAGEQPSDRRVTLVSASAAPEVIGGAVADELERLGYEINTLATDEATAQRDGSSLGLRISPEALDLENSNGRRFPDAQPGSVAIDLWVRDDSAV